MNIFLYRPDLNLGAMIQALEQKNIAQILSEPNLMARSGEPAKFLAGGEFPFPVVQGGTGNGTAVTIVFKPYGVKLEFTATVVGNEIHLKIAPEVSTLDFTNSVTISGFQVPALSTRRAETDIQLKDGQSFGIAGLLDRRTTVQLSKIPGIGDIPILGELFKSRSVNKTNTDLLVMVTPTIVDPTAESLVAPTVPVPSLDQKHFDSTFGSRYTQPGQSTTNGK
jgi:pilus assembly protein CpaC